jgi:hypothetical protein
LKRLRASVLLLEEHEEEEGGGMENRNKTIRTPRW